jgi:ABC-2 type transport system permease protein
MVVTLPEGRAGFHHSVASEWTKFWSVRSTPFSLAATAVAILGICVLGTATVSAQEQVGDPTRRSLIGFFLGQFAIGVLGVLMMSAEYGTGSIHSTLAATPRRPLVLAAKVAVFGAVALVVSEALAFASFLIGQAIMSGTTQTAALGDPGVLRAVIGSGLYLALLGLLALGLGTILRHTAGALSAYVGIVLVLPLIAQAMPMSILDAVSRYLPANIGLVVFSVRTPEHFFDVPVFGPWAGLALLAGYAAAALVLGWVLLVRRDA